MSGVDVELVHSDPDMTPFGTKGLTEVWKCRDSDIVDCFLELCTEYEWKVWVIGDDCSVVIYREDEEEDEIDRMYQALKGE